MTTNDPLRNVRVPLAWLVELDNCPSTNALDDAIGDRYLYRHNPVFRNVRDAAVAFDYRFSSQDTPLWRDYHSFALLTLHRILSERTIPYFDNGKTLERLLEKDLTTALPPRFILNNLTANHVFHESGHCVAHQVLRQHEFDMSVPGRSEKDQFVIEAILEESFANTVEMLGNAFEDSISHALFYALNSFTAASKQTKELLHRSGQELGEDLRFILLFLSYLEANLATGRATELNYRRINDAAECPSIATALAKELTDLAFTLNSGFRLDTTPVYFALLGYDREYTTLVGTPWLERDFNKVLVRRIIQPFLQISKHGPNCANSAVV